MRRTGGWLTVAWLVAATGCAGRLGRPTVQEPSAAAAPSSTTASADTLSAALTDSTIGEAGDSTAAKGLSPASGLMVRACDNYLAVNPQSAKAPQVLSLKASVFYNVGRYATSRDIYRRVVEEFGQTPEAVDAVRMTAQSFYEEKQFDQAQQWYRKLSDMAASGGGKEEALTRIAESIFRMAESMEAAQRFDEAAAQYERAALEFPDVAIADVALFNAGLAYEKLADWSRAILVYQRLRQRYQDSKLVSKSMFRSAKAYEKLSQWDEAAELYLRLAAMHPSAETTPVALYNAGFCFENAGKLVEAAATFEKLAKVFPDSDDAADVLFRAGEIYGKLKDWPNVTRVNQEFSRRYGNDADRVIQALCMVGVALYMQDRQAEALQQLASTVAAYKKLTEPSPVNRHYAAKARFTMGEIYQGKQNAIELIQPTSVYRRLLKEKSQLLDQAVEAYAAVIDYGISEWTTRSIYQIGQAYEDFAVAIFRQQRPPDQSVDERMALELGIAKAVEEYFVDRALPYHEQNVKLGLKEKIEDKYVLASRKKLPYLPSAAGGNYLALADIAVQVRGEERLDGFALIANKLSTLQKVGPFQERAIELFLKSLELGTRYQEYGDFYKTASQQITKTSFTAGTAYADISRIALEAPIPESFDPYERFVYKTKLLKQIEGYIESSLTNYLKTLKIAQAYGIKDEFVDRTKERIPALLFTQGRSYDLLCIAAIQNPPFPADVSEEEKEEYRARFEEIGLRLQEEGFDIYRRILEFEQEGYAAGEFVNHAYVRLYQTYPQDYGVVREKRSVKTIVAGPQWRASAQVGEEWWGLSADDKEWGEVERAAVPDSVTFSGFPDGKTPPAMWAAGGAESAERYFRRTFYITSPPYAASLYLASVDSVTAYLNDKILERSGASPASWSAAAQWELTGRLRQGKNVLALRASVPSSGVGGGLIPLLTVTVTVQEHLPQFPGTAEPVDRKTVAPDTWRFPPIRNFSPEPVAEAGAGRLGGGQ